MITKINLTEHFFQQIIKGRYIQKFKKKKKKVVSAVLDSYLEHSPLFLCFSICYYKWIIKWKKRI